MLPGTPHSPTFLVNRYFLQSIQQAIIFILQYILNYHSNIQLCAYMLHTHPFSFTYMHINTGFNHTPDQKLSPHNVICSCISLFTLGFHSGVRERQQHMGRSQRVESVNYNSRVQADQTLSSRLLQPVKSSSHSITCCPQAVEVTHRGGVNDW